MDAEKPCTSNRSSIRERKLTLQQDVSKFLFSVCVFCLNREGIVVESVML